MKNKIAFAAMILILIVLTLIGFNFIFIEEEQNQDICVQEKLPTLTVTFSHFEMYVPPVEEMENVDVPIQYEEEKQPVSGELFELTAYCPCEKCCGKWAKNRPQDENGKPIVIGSTGKRLIAGKSIAVDPKVIPYGTTVLIDGVEYVAEDCGGAIKGNRIDVFFDSHEDALDFGRQKKLVVIGE